MQRGNCCHCIYGASPLWWVAGATVCRRACPSLSLNLVTDEEKVTKSVTKLNDTLNDIIDFCSTPRSMIEIMEHIGLKHRYNMKHRYIDPLLEGGFLVMTVPEKPNSRSQKYKRALT